MRKAMICVTFMLALVHFWPLVFGQGRSPSDAVSVPAARAASIQPAIATTKLTPLKAKTEVPHAAAPKSCFPQYQAAVAKCAADDQACRLNVADRWDLCEATGFWPN